jgi:hypothetical protein
MARTVPRAPKVGARGWALHIVAGGGRGAVLETPGPLRNHSVSGAQDVFSVRIHNKKTAWAPADNILRYCRIINDITILRGPGLRA